MQSSVIYLSARDQDRRRWLHALETIDAARDVVAVSDEADLLTLAPRDGIAAVIVHRNEFPGIRDATLTRLRAAFSAAKFLLSVPRMPVEGLDTLRALGIDGCIPGTYSEPQRRLALELALEGVGTIPAALPAPVAATTEASSDERSPPAGLPPESGERCRLTPRETDVAVWLVRGQTNHEIAATLGLSALVVRNHVSNILRKVGVDSRVKALPILLRLDTIRTRLERESAERSRVLDWMIEHVEHIHYRQGTVIFRKGEPGGHMYYIQRGTVGLDEIDDVMGAGEIFGDIGAFAPRHLRTCTARARTDIDLFRLDAGHVRRIFFESPEFAYYVVSVITERIAQERGL